jgi:hypothetical protein
MQAVQLQIQDLFEWVPDETPTTEGQPSEDW